MDGSGVKLMMGGWGGVIEREELVVIVSVSEIGGVVEFVVMVIVTGWELVMMMMKMM